MSQRSFAPPRCRRRSSRRQPRRRYSSGCRVPAQRRSCPSGRSRAGRCSRIRPVMTALAWLPNSPRTRGRTPIRLPTRAAIQGPVRSAQAPPGRGARRARASRSSRAAASRESRFWRGASRRRSPQQSAGRLGRAFPCCGEHALSESRVASPGSGGAQQNRAWTRRSWVLLPLARRIVSGALPAPASQPQRGSSRWAPAQMQHAAWPWRVHWMPARRASVTAPSGSRGNAHVDRGPAVAPLAWRSERRALVQLVSPSRGLRRYAAPLSAAGERRSARPNHERTAALQRAGI
jgi:hypothetical protein